MNSSPPTLTGFNNNVRYRGMRFHIQTEDSGVSKPHITTHLFADGGYVIKSLRTEYAEYVDHPERVSVVQRMMREQHRAMALELRDGKLDATIDRIAPSPPEDEEAEHGPATQLSARPPAPAAAGERALALVGECGATGGAAAGALALAALDPQSAAPKSRPAQRDTVARAGASVASPTGRSLPGAADSAPSGQAVASEAESQPLWDTELRPKNQGGSSRSRRRSSEPRSSRRAPASSSSAGKGTSSGPPGSSTGGAPSSAEAGSSRRSGSQRAQNKRPSSRSPAASSRPKPGKKSDAAANPPAKVSEAPASSRRSGSSRAGRAAAAATDDRATEAQPSSRRSRAPRVDVVDPQPSSAPSSSRRGRPAAALPAKPAGPSLFGPLPQDSLDDAILTFAARTKTPPSSRGSK